MARETRSSAFTAETTTGTSENPFAPWWTSELGNQAFSYWIDSWQRTWLFWGCDARAWQYLYAQRIGVGR